MGIYASIFYHFLWQKYHFLSFFRNIFLIGTQLTSCKCLGIDIDRRFMTREQLGWYCRLSPQLKYHHCYQISTNINKHLYDRLSHHVPKTFICALKWWKVSSCGTRSNSIQVWPTSFETRPIYDGIILERVLVAFHNFLIF